MKKHPGSILIIDDDEGILVSLRLLLKQYFENVLTETSPKQLITYLNQGKIDVLLLDMNFRRGDNTGREGLYWLDYIKKVNPAARVILMTAYGEVNLAVQALKQGAHDFILKPWQNEKLLNTVISALKDKSKPQSKVDIEISEKMKSDDLLGESAAMKSLKKAIEKIAATNANVLILGENGTGKELVAREIHLQSQRALKDFVTVDLAAVTPSLFESELFGHAKGAFTDAQSDKKGRFEMANKGSLFLDEIGNIPLNLQAKLLTVLQQRRMTRLGEAKETEIDIRLIAATNMDPEKMVEEGVFRQDLLYRINTLEIHLPPLREREGDIVLLADHYLEYYNKKYFKNVILSREAVQELNNHSWPGNVRELKHCIERAVIMSDGPLLKPSDLALQLKKMTKFENEIDLNLAKNERRIIEMAFNKNMGNISQTAKELGITRAALYRRLEKYGL